MQSAPAPNPGVIVALRRRRWLARETEPGRGNGDATVVRLHDLDDAAGEPLKVLWELELGPRVLREDLPPLGTRRPRSGPIPMASGARCMPRASSWTGGGGS